MDSYYLGIDGGSTKTAAVLGDSRGRVLARVLTGPLSLQVISPSAAVGLFRRLARQLLRGRRGKLQWTVVGLAGDTWPVSRAFRQALRSYGGGLTIVNDSALGFGTQPPLRRGAVMIAGTGSHAVARGPRGERHTSGMGKVLSDDGSGYAQGLLALRAAAQAFDGRGPATRLEAVVRRYFHASSVPAIAQQREQLQDKRVVAGLAPFIERAAQRGDRVARGILRSTAVAAADALTAAARQSGLTGRVPVVEIGGMFKASYYRRVFEQAVRTSFPKARFIRPTDTPAVAAYRLALQRGRT